MRWFMVVLFGVVGMACGETEPVLPDASTPADAGVDAGTEMRDAGSPDSGEALPDAGTPDAGMTAPDAGTPDAGPTPCMGPPRLEIEPTDTITFPASPSSEVLTIRNLGCDPLDITQFDILGPSGTPMHPSIDDFSLPLCLTLPCQPGVTICGAEDPQCADSDSTFFVAYANNDASAMDLAELSITTNAPAMGSRTIVLSGASDPCLFPTASIRVITMSPQTGVVVDLDASGSSPGGIVGGNSTIVDYQWRYLFAPGGGGGPFTPQGVVTTSFLPSVPGIYFVGLDVTNDCGAVSQAPATEMINVQ